MEIHKPILSKQELKILCEDISKEIKTPLPQALAAIKEIQRLRALTPNTEISLLDWQMLEENQVYLKIAREFIARKLKLKAIRQLEREAKLSFNPNDKF